ncbi:MAG: isopenicillin-N epimerase, partial [Frankiaceae bacterium]|nr:isopenicillin-N epimerase [Frankiaceae bacterium]
DWTGTADPVPLFTVPATLDFWDGLGWDDVRRKQRALATDGARHTAEALSTRVAIRDEFTAAMRIVELPRRVQFDEGVEIGYRLTTEHKVTAYITHHGGASYVRMCGQLYNTPDDYTRLADGLRTLLS